MRRLIFVHQGGIVLGIAGANAGSCDEDDVVICEGKLGNAIIGLSLGSAVGVSLVGNIGDAKGSFPATLGGSFIGLLVGIATLTSGSGDWWPLLAGPPIGATIGFNMTRGYWEPVYLPLQVDFNPHRGRYMAISVDLLKIPTPFTHRG